jgi:ADP-ribosylglycohydrolase
MIGAIIGDIVGSVYEFDNHKSKEFPLFREDSMFTDDTVMTIAVADFLTLEHGNPSEERFCAMMYDWYMKYPELSYGAGFRKWIEQFGKDSRNWKRNNSFGNGAAMRISSVGVSSSTLEKALYDAELLTKCSHNHKEGIKGAQAVAGLMVVARKEKDKSKLKAFVEKEFGYNLNSTVDELRETYEYNETCQGTVPEAIICFLESTDFEDAIRNAISIGGDSDTLACITGGIAEAYYQEIPETIIKEAIYRLPKDIKQVLFDFYKEVQSQYPKIAVIIFKYTNVL